MREEPKPGEFYRHFKNKFYQIICVATHSESGERQVVYQALYGDFGIYARPLDMFLGEVDSEKYLSAVQKYRFEKISRDDLLSVIKDSTGSDKNTCSKKTETDGEETAENYFLDFLEADDYNTKKQILTANKQFITERVLDSIYDIYGLKRSGKDIEIDIADLISYLDMRQQYEGKRLRK